MYNATVMCINATIVAMEK